jgi:2-amino-4-hydroxy-6-hydroxymethyldihydropteridine diphosphokinase
MESVVSRLGNRPMPHSLVALGSNLGDRRRALDRAVELLAADSANAHVVASQPIETPPAGGPQGQGPFLNAAVAFETTHSPEQLHALLRRIELDIGRQPGPRWAPRVIDLDLLLYDDAIVATQVLSIPHPRMSFRRFVLAPAAQIAPRMVHPLSGWTVSELLAHLDAAAPYVALLGTPEVDRSTLAQAAARAVGGAYLGDPAGHTREPPIQFLDRATRLLREHDWRGQHGEAVSDFYLDECLAYGRLDPDVAEESRLREAWQAARQSVPRPKLVVVLDTFEQVVAAARGRSGQKPGASRDQRLRHELLALAARQDQGPVLFAGDDPQAQLNEITAAIAAMH